MPSFEAPDADVINLPATYSALCLLKESGDHLLSKVKADELVA